MADLVNMRADAAAARKCIDGLLAIDGELSSEQNNELETADGEYRQLKAKIKAGEIRESAIESSRSVSYEFKGNSSTALAKAPEARSMDEMFQDAGDRLLRRCGHKVENRANYDTVTDTALVPVDLRDELIRRLPKISGAMAASTVVTEPHDNEIGAVVNRIPTATIVNEGAAFVSAQATFSRIRFRAYKMALESQISVEMLMDNRISAMSESLLQHTESYAEGWDAAFLAETNPLDSSRAAPGGLCATSAHINAAGATDINDSTMIASHDAVSNLAIEYFLATQAAVPGRYRTGDKSWIMSPDVHAKIVQSIDANDRMIFLPAATGTLQEDPLSVGTLLGSPIYLSDAMPTPGAGKVAALYLDRRSYRVALRQTLMTQEDPFTLGASGLVSYRSHMRADGQWTLAEASSRLIYGTAS